jgi:hypothetical protein
VHLSNLNKYLPPLGLFAGLVGFEAVADFFKVLVRFMCAPGFPGGALSRRAVWLLGEASPGGVLLVT